MCHFLSHKQMYVQRNVLFGVLPVLTIVLASSLCAPTNAAQNGNRIPESNASKLIQLGDTKIVTNVRINDDLHTLKLAEHSLRSSDFVLKKQTESGACVVVNADAPKTVRGIVIGAEGSRVVGSVIDSQFYGKISLGGEVHFVEPQVQHQDNEPIPDQFLNCHCKNCIDAERRRSAITLTNNRAQNVAHARNEIAVARIAIDADYDYFLDYGSVENVLDRIELIMNICNDQFENQTKITHEIAAVIVRSSEPDPYTGTNLTDLLFQLQHQWETSHQDIKRDTTHLFSGAGEATLTGVAFDVGAICNPNSYAVSISQDTKANKDINLCLESFLVTHELGHLWNADHCDCPGFTMVSALDFFGCVDQFHPEFTIPEIMAYRESLPCLGGTGIPLNDNFSDREPISPGNSLRTIYRFNFAATIEEGEPNTETSGATAWWELTGQPGEFVWFSTLGSDFDTRIDVYSGNPILGELIRVASNDNSNGNLTSEVVFPVLGNTFQKYYVRVSGKTENNKTESGNIRLQFRRQAFSDNGIYVYLSNRNLNTGSNNVINPKLIVSPGEIGTLYVYLSTGKADINRSAIVDFSMSNNDVIRFTNATVLDFDILENDLPISTRWSTGDFLSGTVMDSSIDEFGVSDNSLGTGLLFENTSGNVLDAGFDPHAEAFIFGRIDYEVIGSPGDEVEICSTEGDGQISNDSGELTLIPSATKICVEPSNKAQDLFWSAADLGEEISSQTEIEIAEDESKTIFLYYSTEKSEIDTRASFDVYMSHTDIARFNDVEMINSVVSFQGQNIGMRWQQTGANVKPFFAENVNGVAIVSGFGIIDQNTGPNFIDHAYDPVHDVFQFAKFEIQAIGVVGGQTTLIIDRASSSFFDDFENITPCFGDLTLTIAEPLIGDVNCDGVVSLLDVSPFVDLLLNGEYSRKADIDGDLQVTLLDVAPFVDLIASN